jgi:hypothetical protein
MLAATLFRLQRCGDVRPHAPVSLLEPIGSATLDWRYKMLGRVVRLGAGIFFERVRLEQGGSGRCALMDMAAVTLCTTCRGAARGRLESDVPVSGDVRASKSRVDQLRRADCSSQGGWIFVPTLP